MSLDQPAIVDEVLAWSASGVGGTANAADVRALVAGWAQEADRMPDPAEVLRYQQEDLRAAADEVDDDRRRAVRLVLLRRQVDELAARTLSLGRDVAAGAISDDDRRRQGTALLAECERLRHEVDDFAAVAHVDAMRASLADSMLDAVYAVERKGMSLRLAHATGDGGPPGLRL